MKKKSLLLLLAVLAVAHGLVPAHELVAMGIARMADPVARDALMNLVRNDPGKINELAQFLEQFFTGREAAKKTFTLCECPGSQWNAADGSGVSVEAFVSAVFGQSKTRPTAESASPQSPPRRRPRFRPDSQPGPEDAEESVVAVDVEAGDL